MFTTSLDIASPIAQNLSCIEVKEHADAMIATLEKIAQEEGGAASPDFWNNPHFIWEEKGESSGCIAIHVSAKALKNFDLSHFLYQMISSFLIPQETVSILSLQHLHFRIKKKPGHLFAAKALVQVEDMRRYRLFFKNIPRFAQEVKRGMASLPYARLLLQFRCMPSDQKSGIVFSELHSLLQRGIKELSEEIFVFAQQILLECNDSFMVLRSARHICRVICTLYIYRGYVKRQLKVAAQGRHLRFKTLPIQLDYSFGTKKALALMVSLKINVGYELFAERHIVKALARFFQDVCIVPHSYRCFFFGEGSICCVYLELEKSEGGSFTLKERLLLRKELGTELLGSIEKLTQEVFMPRNEEEILRSVLTLSQELKYVHDLPQVVISFAEQVDTRLCFNVVLLRIVKGNEKPLKEIFENLPQGVAAHFEQIKIVGSLRRKYSKEASVFNLIFPKEHYLRRDHSIDLFKARDYVVKLLQLILGEVRDYNGGLIVKQSQTLDEVKKRLPFLHSERLDLLETFFYAISPAVMQSLLSPTVVQQWYLLFWELHKYPKEASERFVWRFKYEKCSALIMIRVDDESVVQQLSGLTDGLGSEDWELASTSFSAHGSHYFGYIYSCEDSLKRLFFVRRIEKAILQWGAMPRLSSVLRLSMRKPPAALHPRMGFDHSSEVLMLMLYEGLMRRNREGKLQPAAARDYHISEEKTRYTFFLRESYWSNGMKVVAQDFEYAWKKMVDPMLQLAFTYLFFPIKNARAIASGVLPIDSLGVQAVNDSTLVVHLEHPAPYFLELTANWIYAPVCREIDQTRPSWSYYAGESYVCNGPFKLAEWRRDLGIRFVKNPYYWDEANTGLQQIEITLEKDEKRTLEMFSLEALDWVGDPLQELPISAIREYKEQNRLQEAPVAALYQVEFNVLQTPFQSPKVRRAFTIALNRAQISEEIFFHLHRPAYALMPPSFSLQNEPYFIDNQMQQARLLFQEGLQELKIALEDLPPLVLTYTLSEKRRRVNEMLVRQWKEALGVDVQLEALPWNEWFDRLNRHDFQLAATNWFSWINDPIYTLQAMQSRQSTMNSPQWENAVFSHHVALSEQCLDADLRRMHLHEAEKILMDELPICPIYYCSYLFLCHRFVDNVVVTPVGTIDFKWAKKGGSDQTMVALMKEAAERPEEQRLDESSPEKGILRIGCTQDPAILDPRVAGDRKSQAILSFLFEGLMRMHSDGKPHLALASSVHVSSDLCTYRFCLKESFWSNGEKVTAYDFEYSWKSLLDPSFASNYAHAFYPIKNARLAKEGRAPLTALGVQAVNPFTLVVTLEHPAPYFLEMLCNPVYFPVPRSLCSHHAKWASSCDTIISNGPFTLRSWQKGRLLELVPNERYYARPCVRLQSVRLQIVANEQAALQQFRCKKLDWIGEPFSPLPYEMIPLLKKEGLLRVLPTSAVYWYFFNLQHPPLNHPKFRRALGLCIDRRSIVENLFRSDEKPALSIFPQGMALGNSAALKDGDKETAARLMHEALTEMGLPRPPPLVISCSTHAHLLSHMVREQWKDVLRVDARIKCRSWEAHFEKITLREFEVAGLGWDSWCNDPIYNLANQRFRGNPMNSSGWEDAKYQHYLDLSDVSCDPGERLRWLQKAEQRLLAAMPIVPIYHITNTYLKHDYVCGEERLPMGYIDFTKAYIKEGNT